MGKVIELFAPVTGPAETPTHVLPGRLFQLDGDAPPENGDYSPQTGLIAGYRLGADAGIIEQIAPTARRLLGFIWDEGLLSPSLLEVLKSRAEPLFVPHRNCLTLLASGLHGPEVRLIDHRPVLSVSPYFKMHWRTEAFAGQLGFVQLVEASRGLLLENGESVDLLATESVGGPVLYLTDANDGEAVKPVGDFQRLGQARTLDVMTEITQPIPARFNGLAVVSLTVLEKYSCYFMQNAAPDDPERHIWTPAHLPISWGWSIRVQQRSDGAWGIFRQKLILPAASTDLPSLPVWQSNTERCRCVKDPILLQT
ncbi:MAG: hypothetical protein ABSB19_10360 [Methylomonas sp.]|jgi:hypothetical protein